MPLFSHEIRDAIAWVRFDSGGMNTLSQAAIEELGALLDSLEAAHGESPLRAVVLRGNRFGLGAGANIGELMQGSRADLERLIDRGHEIFNRIETGPVPWLALIEGYALGGIYELALACRALLATPDSTVGFPEIKLNIFPGLGGTQRMPRRSGLVHPTDPVKGAAGFTAILTGKNFRAPEALAIGMLDALVPAGEEPEAFAARFVAETLPGFEPPSVDLSNAEQLAPMVMPMIRKATQGRDAPRAPYVALEVMVKGAGLPLAEALRIERDAFIEVADSSEGKAGMRFFFTQQQVQKLPEGFPGKPRKLAKIGVDGCDGYMGNAIAWLALEAGYAVVGHVPLAKFADSVHPKLLAKYAYAVKKGKLSEAQAAEKVAQVKVTTEVADLADCDLVLEARFEDREVKAEFYRALGAALKPDAVVASNSSSMGPGLLAPYFAEGGGDPSRFVNLHFFSPAEHPMMQLVEVIQGEKKSDPEAVATAHGFVRKIGKTPLLLRDGSPAFLVNAGLAAYFGAAEELYLEGTPVERIDAAIRAAVLPMGPFELGDQAGLDIAAGMYDTIAAVEPPEREPLVWKMREAKRFGIKSGGGYYAYQDGKKQGVWDGLDDLAGERGDREASDAEIVERCVRALHDKARELLERGIVASAEEADLAFVYGIGFAMHEGGPLYYGRQRGWS